MSLITFAKVRFPEALDLSAKLPCYAGVNAVLL